MHHVPSLRAAVITTDTNANATHPSLIKVQQVCEDCNSGWMSGLEDAAKPLFVDLSEHSRAEFSGQESRLLACWAVKTAIMFEFNDVQSRVFSEAQLRDLYVARRIPRQTQVFAGLYDGDSGSRLLHQHSTVHRLTDSGSAAEVIGHTAEIGIALGRAAFLVRTIVPANLGPVSDYYSPTPMAPWSQIWPNTPDRTLLMSPAMDDQLFTDAIVGMRSDLT